MAKPPFKRRGRREETRVNERIRVSKVRVVDGTTGDQLGVMQTRAAVQKAKEMGLDLVEVASNANPPVCRICDYGKWKYEQSKLKKDKKKSKQQRTKEVKFRPRIEEHDYTMKLARAESFLDEGNKLHCQLQFRGREMAHPELGMALMKRVIEDLKGMAAVDFQPRQAGRNITMMLSPLPEQQRVRKFSKYKAEDLPEEDDDDEGDDA
ncbi:translation initiation factor IF-3 [Sulfuriroseicoccus oceanibius]|uniref:Translation initiation factor IF-3 n=1 Tax=Sulfuriroseicoccus oceanibius TaxID=2707525 RepID=A0A6B3LDT3_9BACT|nr:translation initiation factor IF-3 [Sulfuriroseicoccus oceanibius]QQL46359.1 translation initiation factor IF-3 [Sulfuriroseicoccus oceanibius]